MHQDQIEYIRIGPSELAECSRLGHNRQQNNISHGVPTQKIASHKSDLEINIEGVIGEYAVSRTLGLGGFENIDGIGADKRGDIALPAGDFIEVKSSGRVGNNFLIEGGDIQTLFRATYGVAVWISPMQVSGVLEQVPFVDVGVVGWCDQQLFDARKYWFGPPMPRPTWGMRWVDLEPLDRLRDRLAWFPVNQHHQQESTPAINS